MTPETERLLAALDAEQRAELQEFFLYASQSDKRVVSTAEEIDLWTVVWETVGMSPFVSLTEFRRTFGAIKFDEAVIVADRFVRNSCKEGTRRVTRLAVLRMCMGCLAKHLQYAHISVTPKALIGAMANMPAAVDRAFPGYASAGLLHRAVNVG